MNWKLWWKKRSWPRPEAEAGSERTADSPGPVQGLDPVAGMICPAHLFQKRQQASTTYGKSGLEGRHAFSAWFLEDFLALEPGTV